MKTKIYLILIILINLSYLLAFNDIASSENIDGTVLEGKLLQIIGDNDENPNAQSALFELAKIKMLERDYQAAHDYLKRIYDEQIIDKEYWLAKAYLKLEDYTRAIISAQNFICDSEDSTKIESAYFLIAEAYLLSFQYKRALNTLETLRNSDYIQNFIPLLFYKIGYCHEKLGHIEDSILAYKKLKCDYPYNEITFQAEERLANLGKNTAEKTETTSSTYNEEAQTYLQAGAFGSAENAHNLGARISQIGFKYIVFDKTSNGKKLYCVAAGPFENKNSLNSALNKLKENQINTYIIKH